MASCCCVSVYDDMETIDAVPTDTGRQPKDKRREQEGRRAEAEDLGGNEDFMDDVECEAEPDFEDGIGVTAGVKKGGVGAKGKAKVNNDGSLAHVGLEATVGEVTAKGGWGDEHGFEAGAELDKDIATFDGMAYQDGHAEFTTGVPDVGEYGVEGDMTDAADAMEQMYDQAGQDAAQMGQDALDWVTGR